MAFLVNKFDCVIVIDDDEDASYKMASGEFRQATDAEISAHQARRELAAKMASLPNSIYYQTVPKSPDGYGMSRDLLQTELALEGIILNESYTDQKVGLLYSYPYGINQMRSDVRIVMTMFESDKIPEDWPDYLMAADEVIVPSRWCQEVFAKSGVESTVVPLGYNDRVFQYIKRPQREVFTFIHYNSFNIRKGFFEVLEAFKREFAPDEKVRLILKTSQKAAALPIMPDQYPNVEVLVGEYSESKLVELLGRTDCMVYPSRGEGFGITPLEAMATGLPAIVPNAHGISEYFNSDYMLEVGISEKCPGLYNRFKGQYVGDMVICDVDDLRRQMRYAFEHQPEMRKLGKKASEYVQGFTYQKTAKRLGEILMSWQMADIVRRPDSKFLKVEAV